MKNHYDFTLGRGYTVGDYYMGERIFDHSPEGMEIVGESQNMPYNFIS